MVITLTGANSFMLQASLQTLLASFINEQGDMAVERLDGSDAEINRLSEALSSLPFLAAKKMVVLRTPGANKQFAEQAETLLANIPETTEVIIAEPKFDKRSSYFKYLKKNTDFRDFAELDANGLARWLVKAANERGGALSAGDASYLVVRVGLGQQLLSNELDKLLLYSLKINQDGIDALTDATPQSTIFELLDAAFAGDGRRTLRLYSEQRALKVEPQQVIAMLSWQLHILALIKMAGQRSPDAIASQAKVSPYVVKKSLKIAHQLRLAQLKRLVVELAKIDSRSKRQAYNIDDALQQYLLQITTFS